MTLDEYEFYKIKNSSFCKNSPKSKQYLTTGLILGTTLAATSIMNPKIRKFAIPTYKYLAKQQVKILAGIGMFSIASLLSCKDEYF